MGRHFHFNCVQSIIGRLCTLHGTTRMCLSTANNARCVATVTSVNWQKTVSLLPHLLYICMQDTYPTGHLPRVPCLPPRVPGALSCLTQHRRTRALAARPVCVRVSVCVVLLCCGLCCCVVCYVMCCCVVLCCVVVCY